MRYPSNIRRAFRRRCLAEIEARYGSEARSTAADAVARPDRLDVFGAALLAEVPPVPANVTVADADSRDERGASPRHPRNAPLEAPIALEETHLEDERQHASTDPPERFEQLGGERVTLDGVRAPGQHDGQRKGERRTPERQELGLPDSRLLCVRIVRCLSNVHLSDSLQARRERPETFCRPPSF